MGIYSGKISYFCSRDCRDRFSSSGRDAAPRPSPPRPQPAAPDPGAPQPVGEVMLPLLESRRDAFPRQGRPVDEPGEPSVMDAHTPALLAVSELEQAPVRGSLFRWLSSAIIAGSVTLTAYLAVERGWLEPSLALAAALLAPAALLGLLHGVLEWRASSLPRAVDEVIVVGAVLISSVPGLLALGRGETAWFSSGILMPLAVLAAVWSARCAESLATGRLENDSELVPLHAPGTIAGLVGDPASFGRSRMARIARIIAGVLTVGALPSAVLVVLGSWLITGRIAVASHWTLAAAVALSLAPRLFRNTIPAVAASSLLRARRMGILFSGDRALEKAGLVDGVVLRKRGVVLEGGSEVVEFHSLGEMPTETVLALVASCEEIASGNEVAEALMRYARREGIKPGDTRMARHHPSRGIHSTSPFGEIFAGNRLFLIENGISVGRGETAASEAEKRGHTAIFISINRNIEAVAILKNRLRASSKQAVDSFHALGLTTVLVTGDSYRTAESLGSTLGVDQIRPEIAFGGREAEVERLRNTGLDLAILGSLEGGPPRGSVEGDLTIGLGWDGEGGVDPAWDVVVTGNDLERAAHAIEIARRGRRFFLTNWTLAVLAGGVTFGLAASGLLSPIAAALIVNLVASLMTVVRPSAAADPA
ncbi:MAG: cation-translocating P-type ATPase [Deltaproteobacteria bacterium]|nr:cation-translocating P-type ATPase [Deltaproteobacteria bacterium]